MLAYTTFSLSLLPPPADYNIEHITALCSTAAGAPVRVTVEGSRVVQVIQRISPTHAIVTDALIFDVRALAPNALGFSATRSQLSHISAFCSHGGPDVH